MLETLKETVCKTNLLLPKYQLVDFTWGNVSGIDREKGLVVIKPSGVEYDDMKPEDMVIVSLQTGEIIEGKWNPSCDTPTHLELYRAFPFIGGIVHTHSVYATGFAQAGKEIPAYGTTHGDYFYGGIPCTREMTVKEITDDYERNTGQVIVETMKEKADICPACLVHSHGSFVWGKDPSEAVYHAVVLERIAQMALLTERLGNTTPMQQELLDKHFWRKHGEHAYYGQN